MVKMLSRVTSFTSVALLFLAAAAAQKPATPDFGPNVVLITPSTPVAAAQAAIAIDRAMLVKDSLRTAALEDNEKLRSTLLASLSHDLRTPLASITGAATRSKSAA